MSAPQGECPKTFKRMNRKADGRLISSINCKFIFSPFLSSHKFKKVFQQVVERPFIPLARGVNFLEAGYLEILRISISPSS